MLAATVYALGSMLAFGIATAASKTLVQQYGAVVATVRREVFSVSVLALLVWWQGPVPYGTGQGIPDTFSWSMLAIGAGIAAVSYGGPFFQLQVLSKNAVGVVIFVMTFRIVIMAIVGFAFLAEPIDPYKVASLCLVVLGVLIATVDVRAFMQSDIMRWSSGVPAALLAACVWGITMPFFAIPSYVLGALVYALVIESTVAAVALVHMLVRGERVHTFAANIVPEIIVGVGLALGTFWLNAALATGEISVTSAVSGASVMVSLLAGAVWYAERLHPRQYIGAGVVTVGILIPLLALV
jgi:drug/metabolite transporter (DMT)-like permease